MISSYTESLTHLQSQVLNGHRPLFECA